MALMTHASTAEATEKAALTDIAIVYRGSSDVGQRYLKKKKNRLANTYLGSISLSDDEYEQECRWDPSWQMC